MKVTSSRRLLVVALFGLFAAEAHAAEERKSIEQMVRELCVGLGPTQTVTVLHVASPSASRAEQTRMAIYRLIPERVNKVDPRYLLPLVATLDLRDQSISDELASRLAASVEATKVILGIERIEMGETRLELRMVNVSDQRVVDKKSGLISASSKEEPLIEPRANSSPTRQAAPEPTTTAFVATPQPQPNEESSSSSLKWWLIGGASVAVVATVTTIILCTILPPPGRLATFQF